MNFKWTLGGTPFIPWLQLISMFSRIQQQLVHNTESVAHSSSVKKVFLRISHNSHKNTCAEVSFFIKLQAETCKPTTRNETPEYREQRTPILRNISKRLLLGILETNGMKRNVGTNVGFLQNSEK